MERLKAIYKLVNSNDEVLYIGQTFDPAQRYRDHIIRKKGKFHDRIDIRMQIIEWVPRIGVKRKEEYWQLFYGLQSDMQKGWETINTDAEKKKRMYEKQKETMNADPKKKIEIQKKRVKTMELKRLKKEQKI